MIKRRNAGTGDEEWEGLSFEWLRKRRELGWSEKGVWFCLRSLIKEVSACVREGVCSGWFRGNRRDGLYLLSTSQILLIAKMEKDIDRGTCETNVIDRKPARVWEHFYTLLIRVDWNANGIKVCLLTGSEKNVFSSSHWGKTGWSLRMSLMLGCRRTRLRGDSDRKYFNRSTICWSNISAGDWSMSPVLIKGCEESINGPDYRSRCTFSNPNA